jgi:hypothetical protein
MASKRVYRIKLADLKRQENIMPEFSFEYGIARDEIDLFVTEALTVEAKDEKTIPGDIENELVADVVAAAADVVVAADDAFTESKSEVVAVVVVLVILVAPIVVEGGDTEKRFNGLGKTLFASEPLTSRRGADRVGINICSDHDLPKSLRE